MATIVWCDRARYVVAEPRSEVQRRMAEVLSFGTSDPMRGDFVPGFSYFTRGHEGVDQWAGEREPDDDGQQVCLNLALVSAFEAVPGHGI